MFYYCDFLKSFYSENAFILQSENDYVNIFGFYFSVHFGFKNKWNGTEKFWIKTSQKGRKDKLNVEFEKLF